MEFIMETMVVSVYIYMGFFCSTKVVCLVDIAVVPRNHQVDLWLPDEATICN